MAVVGGVAASAGARVPAAIVVAGRGDVVAAWIVLAALRALAAGVVGGAAGARAMTCRAAARPLSAAGATAVVRDLGRGGLLLRPGGVVAAMRHRGHTAH